MRNSPIASLMSSLRPAAFCLRMASRIRLRPLTSENTSSHWSSSTCRKPLASSISGLPMCVSRFGIRVPIASRDAVVSPLPIRIFPFLPWYPRSSLWRPSSHAPARRCSFREGSLPVRASKRERTSAYRAPYFVRKSEVSLMIAPNSSTKSTFEPTRFIPRNRPCMDAMLRRMGNFAAKPLTALDILKMLSPAGMGNLWDRAREAIRRGFVRVLNTWA